MRITSLLFALICGLGLQAQFFNWNSELDSGEVIGDFLYLFSASDTVIVDFSSLTVSSDSLWSVSTDKYKPIFNNPFDFTFGGNNLVNDSVQINAFKFPFVGGESTLGSFKYFNGIVDFAPAAGAKSLRMQAVKNSDFSSFYVEVDSVNASLVYDNGLGVANEILVDDVQIRIATNSDNEVTSFNSNGVVIPRLSIQPTGEEGAIIYNTADSSYYGFDKASSSYVKLLRSTDVGGFVSYMDTTYNAVTPYTLPSDSVEKLPFRWTSVLDSYLPTSIDSAYSRADSTIQMIEGTAFDLMLYFKATPSNNAQWVDIWLDIGGSIGELYRQTFNFPRGAGVERGILYSLPSPYALNTFESNGATIYIQSNHDLDIHGTNLNMDFDYLN